MTEIDPLVWAAEEAERLRDRVSRASGGGTGDTIRPIAASALEFLRRYAAGSEFRAAADNLFKANQPLMAADALNRVAEILDDWVTFVRSGMATVQPLPVEARVMAATDLMEQVQQLLDSQGTHPAAAVVLAGAALEEFLKAQMVATGAVVRGQPGMNSYATALRAADYLTQQDVKDITSWAGQRNEAAHGSFELLTRQRAQIMVDGINLFLRQKTVDV